MRRLGELEAQVMQRIWARGGVVTVRDIVGDLQRDRQVAYTTVMTVMDNLRKKGWLRRSQGGRAYLYEPTVSGAEYSAAIMRQVLATTVDRAAALTHFIGDLSADEADALDEAYRRHTRQISPAHGADE
jgi:predicted transcriptional regulator